MRPKLACKLVGSSLAEVPWGSITSSGGEGVGFATDCPWLLIVENSCFFFKILKKDLFGSEMLNLPWYYIIVSWSLGLGC